MPSTQAPALSPLLWQSDAQGWVLRVPAGWQGQALGQVPAQALSGRVRVEVHPAAIPQTTWAPALWALLQPWVRAGVSADLSALPPSMRAALSLALRPSNPVHDLQQAAAVVQLVPSPMATGATHLRVPHARPAPSAWTQAVVTVRFVGEVVLATGRCLRRPRVFRAADLLHHMGQMGPGSLPIVGLTVFLVGLMLAYMGGAQLGRIGAQSFIADVVTVGVVRELAALMTGVILAGRVGAAIAAQLGTMTVNEEIDALRTLGIDPVVHLVLPRLLAMLLVAPLLIALAMLVGVLAGLPAALWVYGVPAYEYGHKCLQALTWTHLWIGLFKGTMYTLLVVVAGCREGLHAGHTAQAIGLATTRAVVKALVWIVVAACASTVVLQSLGF
jgi:phospholipid/cholesterol/gamma-HCH transport system permease protein